MNSSNISKGIFGKIILIIISLVILFVVFEVGFRLIGTMGKWVHSFTGKEIWAIYDKDLQYRLRPDYEDHNSDGLRSGPIDPVKTKFRILMLGDSIPYYGDSISDTYVGRLEKKLNKIPKIVPTEVLNAGTKGYTTYQELIYLKKYGLNFKPDVVGISFCLNDLHKFLHQFEVQNGKIVGNTYQMTKEAVNTVDSPIYQLAHKSRFLVWLRRKLSIFGNIIDLKTKDGFTFDYRPDFNPAWKDKPWDLIDELLDEMVQIGKKKGFRVFLVAFPFGEQLRDDYLSRDIAYVTKPQRKLKSICKKHDIAYLDLFNYLEREKHLLDDDIHLTKEGKKLVATKIAAFLKGNDFVPHLTTNSR